MSIDISDNGALIFIRSSTLPPPSIHMIQGGLGYLCWKGMWPKPRLSASSIMLNTVIDLVPWFKSAELNVGSNVMKLTWKGSSLYTTLEADGVQIWDFQGNSVDKAYLGIKAAWKRVVLRDVEGRTPGCQFWASGSSFILNYLEFLILYGQLYFLFF